MKPEEKKLLEVARKQVCREIDRTVRKAEAAGKEIRVKADPPPSAKDREQAEILDLLVRKAVQDDWANLKTKTMDDAKDAVAETVITRQSSGPIDPVLRAMAKHHVESVAEEVLNEWHAAAAQPN